MKDIKFEDKTLIWLVKLLRAELSDSGVCPPKKSRAMGGSRKKSAPDVREALFTYFVDIRGSLKGRFPKRLLTLKARQLYSDWIKRNPLQENERPLKFGNQWVKEWECEYISLRKPNKRFRISQEDRIIRVNNYLQNIWSVRQYFIRKYNIDPPVINGDQMPLHRNESSEQKTLTFKNQNVFVKENHMLSRERITCFTSVSSSEEVKILPEFVFNGVGTRKKINAPPMVTESYRLEHLKKTISNLTNRYNMFSEKDFAIYVLDDYAVHLMPEVRQALYDRGYVLVVMGGGITGDLQVNDTHTHRALKRH